MGGRSAVSGSVPLPVAVCTLHFLVGAIVVKITLITLWECTGICLGRCWCGRGVSGMNCHDLLFLYGLLSWLTLLLVYEIPLVITPLFLFGVGSHYSLSYSMINDFLREALGIV